MAEGSNRVRPLEGVRVVEMGSLLAGPFCGQLLADFGAEGIKLEPPGKGDPMRVWGRHRKEGHTLWWPIIARNKKSVTINLREGEGQDLARRLILEADVVVENFRPGTLEKWGLGYEALSGINPGLVMVRVSGYGQTGPYKDQAGVGSIGEAMGGVKDVARDHARGENQEELDALISDWTSRRNAEEVLDIMKEAGVPAGKLFTAEDMLSDEQYAAREDIVEVEDPDIGPFPMQNVVPRLSETPGGVRWTGPKLGQHNQEIYTQVLGMSEEDLDALRERGIV